MGTRIRGARRRSVPPSGWGPLVPCRGASAGGTRGRGRGTAQAVSPRARPGAAAPAVIASLRRDGSPHTVATWYDWEDGRVLLNMDESRLRLRFMRRDRRVALTVLDEEGWHRHVSLLGRIVSLEEDLELRDIDRLA